MTNDIPLPFRVKLCFGIGAIGEAIYFAIFIGFITIFYNQAIGLPNYLIGIATMLAVATDAVTDPFIGMLSDRHRSNLGRRHPFLWAAPIPLAVSIYAIFTPPDILIGNDTGLFLWLAAWTILSRTFVTLFNVPHLALGAELSKRHDERSQLFSANAMFGYFAGSAFAFTAWTMFQGERVRASDGALVPGQLRPRCICANCIHGLRCRVGNDIHLCHRHTGLWPQIVTANRFHAEVLDFIFLKSTITHVKKPQQPDPTGWLFLFHDC